VKLASVEAIARALDENGVPFTMVGGVAVAAHGYGRQTQALDIVVCLQPERPWGPSATGLHGEPPDA
jgi:hypothetical protein